MHFHFPSRDEELAWEGIAEHESYNLIGRDCTYNVQDIKTRQVTHATLAELWEFQPFPVESSEGYVPRQPVFRRSATCP